MHKLQADVTGERTLLQQEEVLWQLQRPRGVAEGGGPSYTARNVVCE